MENFRDNILEGNIGESWDIACHPDGTGMVANGGYKGNSFDELIKKYASNIVGSMEKFLLLVILINSREKLSVQVHS